MEPAFVVFYWIFLILLIMGGLNWGLVAIFTERGDIVRALFGDFTGMARFLYGLIGLSALCILVMTIVLFSLDDKH